MYAFINLKNAYKKFFLKSGNLESVWSCCKILCDNIFDFDLSTSQQGASPAEKEFDEGKAISIGMRL